MNDLDARFSRAITDLDRFLGPASPHHTEVFRQRARRRRLMIGGATAVALSACVAGLVVVRESRDGSVRSAATNTTAPSATAPSESAPSVAPPPSTAPATAASTDPTLTVAEFVGALRQAASDGDYATAAAMWTGYPYAESERLDRVAQFAASNEWLLDGELRFDEHDAWGSTQDAAPSVVAVTRTDWSGAAAFLVGATGMVERIQLPEQAQARISADRTRATLDAVPVEGGVAVYAGGERLDDDAIVIDPTTASLTLDLAGIVTSDPLLVVVSAATAELPGAFAFIVPGTPEPQDPVAASVSYLDPPPELTMRYLATVDITDGLTAFHSVAIGDLGVAVFAPSETQADVAHLVDVSGGVRTVELPGDTVGPMFAYGPGDIVYATFPHGDFEQFVIGALSVTAAGTMETVATTPANWMRFIELPTGAYGHGARGVRDRRSGELNGEMVISYVDAGGNEVTLEPAPAWFTLDPGGRADGLGGVVTSSAGRSWTLDVEAAADRAELYGGSAPPAASANGSGVYWTHIGPNADPGVDFGTPTMWVIAEMRADGTVSWWSIPAGWEVAASDIWGTVLTRQTGNQLEIALADF